MLTVFFQLKPLLAGWSSEKSAFQLTFSRQGSYHTYRIRLIHLHVFAKCLIALSFSVSLGSRQLYVICVQLITVILFHLHKTHLCPLPDWWFSLLVKFVCYLNHAFWLDHDPATSSRVTRMRARTNKWDMPAEHAFSCACDELKCAVDESKYLDNAK